MSKAVLISIRPKWCELIVRGKKTIEVRKTAPKIETPFKCYIYETRGFERVGNENLNCVVGGNGRGAVIGEFVCDRIESTNCFSGWVCPEKNNIIKRFLDGSCLSEREIVNYADGRAVCGWHISMLKIYDEPKALKEFTPCCKFMLDEKQCDYRKIQCFNQQDSFLEEDGCNCLNFVKRPPQSWKYVEELT